MKHMSLKTTKYWSRQGLAVTAIVALITFGWMPRADAQATATVAGAIRDSQGAVVPGATVTLTSETRGTVFPGTSGPTGDFVFTNIPGDTYTVSVKMSGFKTVERAGIAAVPGDRIAIPTLTLELGNLSETIQVSAEVPLVQTQTGERSAVIEQQTVQNVPVSGTFFAQLVALTPGVNSTSSNAPTRLDNLGNNQARTNYMLDGVTSVNTGGNQPGINLNFDSVAEVKVLTNAYQAEYGRSSGLQVIGITKSGSNQFHGSLYDFEQRSNWNTNAWVNQHNGVPKTVANTRYWGGTISGPGWQAQQAEQTVLFRFRAGSGHYHRSRGELFPRTDRARAAGRFLQNHGPERRALQSDQRSFFEPSMHSEQHRRLLFRRWRPRRDPAVAALPARPGDSEQLSGAERFRLELQPQDGFARGHANDVSDRGPSRLQHLIPVSYKRQVRGSERDHRSRCRNNSRL